MESHRYHHWGFTAVDRSRRIVVAGGSLAGYSAVSELQRLGYRDEVLWVTGDSHAPYSRPALSKEFMQGRFDVADILLPPVAGETSNIRTLGGRTCKALHAADRFIELDQGERVEFDGLLVCTGATARMPFLARGIGGVFALRTLDDALAIRSQLHRKPRVAVLGGGLIGCELTASMRSLGLQVTLIEAANALLLRAFGENLGEFFCDLHRRHGVHIATGATVDGLLTRDGRVTEASLSDGTTVTADLMLIGAGCDPATKWLDDSGLELSDGIVCDSYLAASKPGIYAAGDVARWFNPIYGTRMRVEHWSSAAAQGRAAARNLLASLAGQTNKMAAFADVPFFWSDQYGLKIQMIGWHQSHDRVTIENKDDLSNGLVKFFKQGRLVAAAGVNASRALMQCRKQIEEEARSAAAVC